jgi:rhamnosyltransferase
MSGLPSPAPGGTVLGVLVAYRPGPELSESVRAALPQVDALLLWENSESPEASAAQLGELRNREPTLPWSRLFSDGLGRNVGLSVAYQHGLDRARREGFSFLLLLDQDSRLEPGAVAELRAVYARLSPLFRVGAVNALNRERADLWLSPTAGLRRLARLRSEVLYRSGRLYRDDRARERRTLINSGLLLPVTAVDSIGGFDDQLFLDAVDYDLALRLRAAGFRLFEAPAGGVAHQQGVPTPIGAGHGRLLVRAYPPRRSYHLVHDTMVVGIRRWRTDRTAVLAFTASMWVGTGGAVLVLPERGARLRCIVAGLTDAGATLRRRPPDPPAPPPRA